MSRITEIRDYLNEFTKDSIYQDIFVIKNRTRIFPNRQIEEDIRLLNKIYRMAEQTNPYIENYTCYNFYSDFGKWLMAFRNLENNLNDFLEDYKNKTYNFHDKNDFKKINTALQNLYKIGDYDSLYQIYKKNGYISFYLPEKWILYIKFKSNDYLDFFKCKVAYLEISNILDPERDAHILGVPFFLYM